MLPSRTDTAVSQSPSGAGKVDAGDDVFPCVGRG